MSQCLYDPDAGGEVEYEEGRLTPSYFTRLQSDNLTMIPAA